MNIPMIPVTRKPVVALIATGDELVMPGEDPRPDQIVASNSFALNAMIEAEGGEAQGRGGAAGDRGGALPGADLRRVHTRPGAGRASLRAGGAHCLRRLLPRPSPESRPCLPVTTYPAPLAIRT
jgi:hypothetical protein